MKEFQFTTSDGITIFGIRNDPDEPTKRILCFHMRPATKESYIPFMTQAEDLGWLCHAIDFRGHGQSTQHNTLDNNRFTPQDRQKYKIDAADAYALLNETGPVNALVGASIGANIALQLQAENNTAKSVLLSAGLDYWGVVSLPFAQQLKPFQSSYIIATHEDNQTAQDAQKLYSVIPSNQKKIDIYDGSEHGTSILDNHPERVQKIINFLQ